MYVFEALHTVYSYSNMRWRGGEVFSSPPPPPPTVWWWCNEAWGTSHHYFLLLQSPSFILLPFLIPPIYCKYAILLPSFLPSISTSCYYTTAAVIYPPITSFTLRTPFLWHYTQIATVLLLTCCHLSSFTLTSNYYSCCLLSAYLLSFIFLYSLLYPPYSVFSSLISLIASKKHFFNTKFTMFCNSTLSNKTVAICV